MPTSATICLLAHIGRDAETKQSANGKPYTKFSVYTTDGSKGEKKYSWWDVTIFGNVPNFKLEEMLKGALVYVTGSVSIREWESNGKIGKSVEVIADAFNGVNVVAPAKDRGQAIQSGNQRSAAPAQRSMEITDEDCPF